MRFGNDDWSGHATQIFLIIKIKSLFDHDRWLKSVLLKEYTYILTLDNL